MHETLLKNAQDVMTKFRIQEATGLNISDAAILLQDFIEMQAINLLERGKFLQARKKALFLPHCFRKYMDSRCEAFFDASIPSYHCAHCSPDCLVNKADLLGKKKRI